MLSSLLPGVSLSLILLLKHLLLDHVQLHTPVLLLNLLLVVCSLGVYMTVVLQSVDSFHFSLILDN